MESGVVCEFLCIPVSVCILSLADREPISGMIVLVLLSWWHLICRAETIPEHVRQTCKAYSGQSKSRGMDC